MADDLSLVLRGKCPDCGHDRWHKSQDGGHDIVLTCVSCNARFGVQESPFDLVERLGGAHG